MEPTPRITWSTTSNDGLAFHGAGDAPLSAGAGGSAHALVTESEKLAPVSFTLSRVHPGCSMDQQLSGTWTTCTITSPSPRPMHHSSSTGSTMPAREAVESDSTVNVAQCGTLSRLAGARVMWSSWCGGDEGRSIPPPSLPTSSRATSSAVVS